MEFCRIFSMYLKTISLKKILIFKNFSNTEMESTGLYMFNNNLVKRILHTKLL